MPYKGVLQELPAVSHDKRFLPFVMETSSRSVFFKCVPQDFPTRVFARCFSKVSRSPSAIHEPTAGPTKIEIVTLT